MADANTEVDLQVFHDAIVADIKAAFPDLKTVEFYREIDERADGMPLPALLLEISEMPASDEDDPQTMQWPTMARIEARVVMGFRTPQVKIAVRKMAGALAVWLRRRRFNDPANPGRKLPTGPAQVVGCFRDEFEPNLDRYEVWRVEWDQQLDLGESVWKPDGTPVPSQPVFSWVPDIGDGNADKYQDVLPPIGVPR
ncbi:hypothetical protein CPT_Mano_009 [Achromobacter phage Mano]|uniref:Minor tail protein n=1 Tax=Achromobacter phage Mano TaxID=2767570 RepID=A0A7L8G6Q8_9CAUD|nr:hypothetical protein KB680_gp09 [Achromobacter phage Mano]QOE32742.1 hypothetical protein CPT_Mano_009 [Achromobacter phage Mano]